MSDPALTAPKVHSLKTWSPFFQALRSGAKTFELRKDDRGFAVGDTLALKEWDQGLRAYTGDGITARVTHIMRGPGMGLLPGYVVMSLEINGRSHTRSEEA